MPLSGHPLLEASLCEKGGINNFLICLPSHKRRGLRLFIDVARWLERCLGRRRWRQPAVQGVAGQRQAWTETQSGFQPGQGKGSWLRSPMNAVNAGRTPLHSASRPVGEGAGHEGTAGSRGGEDTVRADQGQVALGEHVHT